jgi:hypothetical protein
MATARRAAGVFDLEHDMIAFLFLKVTVATSQHGRLVWTLRSGSADLFDSHQPHPTSEIDGGPHCNCGRRPSFELALNLDTAALPPLAPTSYGNFQMLPTPPPTRVLAGMKPMPPDHLAFGSHWHDGVVMSAWPTDRAEDPPIARRRRRPAVNAT